MNLKSCSVKIKAGPEEGLEEGQFIGYASVFGNVDSYGDVVEKGAFKDTLKAWKSKGQPIPLLWGHNLADPDYNIGYLLSAEEDERGLKVHAQIDMDSPKAAQVYRLLKSGRVSEMSFAYDVIEGGMTKSDELGEYFSLKKLNLYEASVVPIGANSETEIVTVKAAAESLRAKAGRVLSAKNETTIRDTIEQLETAAASLKSVLPAPAEEDEEDQDQTSGKSPSSGKSAQTSPDATSSSPVVCLAAHEITLLELEGAQ